MRFGFSGLEIGSILGKTREKEQKSSRLCTEILPADTGSAIEYFDGAPRRCISRLASAYTYSFMFGISNNDRRCMEIAKAEIISQFSTANSNNLPSIDQARSAASLKLAELSPPDRIQELAYVVAHDTVGYGPISMLLEDRKNIEEIEISSPESPIVVYSTRYGRCITNLAFSGEAAFRGAINRMVLDSDKEISESTPIVDAQVADLRLHAQIRPYAISGAAASIRIGGRKEIDLSYLISKRTASSQMLSYLWMAMECRYNLIVSGAPASGKTTFLGALRSFFPSNEKVITVEEDVNEINSHGILNTVALYGSRYGLVTPKEQVINALRMRPGRIVIGEMRGDEARDLFMGANIGISFAATMHSNEGGMQILRKLMVRPMSVDIKGLGALDIAIYMKQADVNRRFVSGIFEYRWLSRAETDIGEPLGEEDMVKVSELAQNGIFDRHALAESKLIGCYCRIHGISAKDALKEFDRRSRRIEKSAGDDGSKSVEKEVMRYAGW